MSASPATTVALGFGYPFPGHADALRSAVAGLPPGAPRTAMERFVAEVADLPLGEWEELHTRTLDLSPLFVPYVGHVAWGESYRRGAFMAEMKAAQIAAGVDQNGELPDHIEPILRYLAAAEDLLPDLAGALPGAVAEMRKDLKKREPSNPYRHLLAAAAAVVDAALATPTGARP
jgi:nitrate reductase molybdenum cofactor assembly chaperone NarJ/NarW